jgi:hypothetical protein
MIRAFNEVAKYEREKCPPPYRYRTVEPIIVAPKTFIGAERIIDYDFAGSSKIITQGYDAAKEKFEEVFKKAG